MRPVFSAFGTPITTPPINAAQLQAKLQQQFTKQGTDYLLNALPPSVKQNQGQWLQVLGDIQSGNYAQAASDGELLVISSVVPVAGIIVGSFIAGIEAIWGADHPAPCTIVGCGSTFGLPECDNFPDGSSPFTWRSIASMGPAPPPADSAYGKLPGSWLTNWADYSWLCSGPPPYQIGVNCASTSPMPSMAGGPGSFEAGLQAAMMSAWDTHASAPWLCKAMKDAGMNGQIYSPGSAGNEDAIWKMLFAYAGSLVPTFVQAWNETHGTGTIVQGGTTKAQCEAAGGSFSNAPSAAGTQCVTPAPQRKVTYGPWPSGLGASGLSTGDPLNAAFYGLSLLAGLPADATISVMINGGPVASSSTTGGNAPAASIAKTIAYGTAGAAAMGLGAAALVAYQRGTSVKSVLRGAWNSTKGEAHRAVVRVKGALHR